VRVPRVVDEATGVMLGCETEPGCTMPATGVLVTDEGEKRFCELHAPGGVTVHVLEPGEHAAPPAAGPFVRCPHGCSHRGSHSGVCPTCGCPASTLM
jgi:hypothetical protein